MRLDSLPDMLSGFDRHVEAGWASRGYDFAHPIRGVVCHHTATPASASGDYPSLRIVRDGRPDLPGPLSQLGLGRSGKVYVIASGRANHAGAGSWKDWLGNRDTIGIEAEHPGGSYPWTAVQYDAYVALCATLRDAFGLTTADIIGHKEWAPTRKPDPTFNMDTFRARMEQNRMVTRADKADDGLDVLQPTFRRALEAGIVTQHTQPGGVAFNDEIVALLERAYGFDVKKRLADLERELSLQAEENRALRGRVGVLEGQSGAGPHTHPEYVRAGGTYRIG